MLELVVLVHLRAKLVAAQLQMTASLALVRIFSLKMDVSHIVLQEHIKTQSQMSAKFAVLIAKHVLIPTSVRPATQDTSLRELFVQLATQHALNACQRTHALHAQRAIISSTLNVLIHAHLVIMETLPIESARHAAHTAVSAQEPQAVMSVMSDIL
jgi:hypothetical protein